MFPREHGYLFLFNYIKELIMFMYLSNRIQRIQESLNDEFITDDEYSYLHDELRELQLEFDKLFN